MSSANALADWQVEYTGGIYNYSCPEALPTKRAQCATRESAARPYSSIGTPWPLWQYCNGTGSGPNGWCPDGGMTYCTGSTNQQWNQLYNYACYTMSIDEKPCSIGYWYSPTEHQCEACPVGSVCNGTGTLVALKPAPAPNNPATSCEVINDNKVGNPILFGTGSKYQTETDYNSPPAHLSIHRKYYSLNGQGKWTWDVVQNNLGLYGSAEVSAYSLPSPVYNSAGFAYAYFNKAGGVQLEFKHTGSGVWQSNTALDVQLSEQVDTLGAKQYVITHASGDKEIYNASGSLLQTQDVQGRVQNYTVITNTDALPDVDEVTITDAVTNYSIHYIFDDQNRIVQAMDADDGVYTYSYTGNNLTHVMYPDATSVTYHYENGTYPTLLTGITDEEGKRYTQWQYDSSGRAVDSQHGINDVGGASEHGSLSYILNTVGDITQANYTNALGRVTEYTLTKVNGRNLVAHVNGKAIGTCLASNSYYNYDTSGYRAHFTDSNGNVTKTIRNDRGLVENERKGLRWQSGLYGTLIQTPSSQKIVTVWQADAALPVTRTYSGWNGTAYSNYKKEDTTYTSNNRIATFKVVDLTQITQPYATNLRQLTWTYSYSYYDTAQTQLQQQIVDGPRTDVSDMTAYNYDSVGNLSSIVDALGHTTTLTDYNSRGLVGSITDQNGKVTQLSYNTRGRLTSLVVNAGSPTSYEYYTNGLLKKVTLPDASWLAYTYNDARHLTKVDNNLGETIAYTPSKLDGEWEAEIVKDASSNIVRQRQRVFDKLGRVMTLQGQNGQAWQYRYDSNNNLINENDALQQVTEYRYDEQNRISETLDAEQTAKADQAQQHAITYQYDGQGNVASVTDQRGNTTQYLYDGFGQLIQQTSPDTGITIFTYSKSGQILSKTDARGSATAYTYDKLNRVTAVQHLGNASEDVSYTYDNTSSGNKGVGRLTSVGSVNGLITYRYDDWGLSQAQWCKASLQCFLTVYTHNSIGQLIALEYPSGNSVNYTYDDAGRVDSVAYAEQGEAVEPIVNHIDYYPFAGMQQIQFANGINLDISADNEGKTTEIKAQGTAVLYDKAYGYNLVNNIDVIDDVMQPQNNRQYQYDKVSRLIQAQKGDLTLTTTDYTYDEVGNRTALQKTDQNNVTLQHDSLSYAIDSNRLLSKTDSIASKQIDYSYDAVGNIVSEITNAGVSTLFTYNQGNRMVVSAVSNGATTAYELNALGQRVLKLPDNDLSKASYFQYGISGEVLAEHEFQTGELLVENIYVNGLLVAQMDARNVDSDGDGWLDKKERACNTDPHDVNSVPVDTDLDGLCNGIDTDDDNDGIIDVNDMYSLIPIGNLVDTDNDGAPDVCDSACQALGMQADVDNDNDQWSNTNEISCETDPLNPQSVPVDTDGDGICDLRELAYCEEVFPGAIQSNAPEGAAAWQDYGLQFKTNISYVYNRYPHMGGYGNTRVMAHHAQGYVNSCIENGAAQPCIISGTPSAKIKNGPVFQPYNPAAAVEIWARTWIGFLKPGTNIDTYGTDFNHVTVEKDRVVTFLNNGSNKVRRIGWMQMDGTNSAIRFAPGDYYIDALTLGSLGNNNRFEVYGSGVVRLFFSNAVEFHHISINTSGAPENFIIYAPNQIKFIWSSYANSYSYTNGWMEFLGSGNYNGNYSASKLDMWNAVTIHQGSAKLSAAATEGFCQQRLDSDNDYWSDDEEVMCQTNPNDAASTPVDTDRDGQCDYLETDDDNDGLPDVADNCPLISNVNQLDSDSDGTGDACDGFPNDPLQQ